MRWWLPCGPWDCSWCFRCHTRRGYLENSCHEDLRSPRRAVSHPPQTQDDVRHELKELEAELLTPVDRTTAAALWKALEEEDGRGASAGDGVDNRGIYV